MTSTTFFIIFIPILAIILLAVNLVLAPHNPYQEKDSAFECGFHSFLGQNRTQFSVSFFIFGLLFLLFDLEILLVYPYSVSSYTNDIYGLVVMMVFFVLLTLGFIFELGKNALTIESRQTSFNPGDKSTPHAFSSKIFELPYLIGLQLKSSMGGSVESKKPVLLYVGFDTDSDKERLIPIIWNEEENSFIINPEKKILYIGSSCVIDETKDNELVKELVIDHLKSKNICVCSS